MATIAAEIVTSSGLDATPHPASVGGDKVPPGTLVRVVNASGGSLTATMVTHQTVDGDLSVTDRLVPVPDAEARFIRASEFYRNPADGLVELQWSPTNVGVTFEVIK